MAVGVQRRLTYILPSGVTLAGDGWLLVGSKWERAVRWQFATDDGLTELNVIRPVGSSADLDEEAARQVIQAAMVQGVGHG